MGWFNLLNPWLFAYNIYTSCWVNPIERIVLAPKKIVVFLAYAPPMRIGIKHKLMMLLAIGHLPTSVHNKISCFK